jgi:uncharacterized protein DUF177 involved in 23S rRNA accumulation
MDERDHSSTAAPWSASVRLDEVPELGRHVELEASAPVRAALAKPAGVDAIDKLAASFDLARRGRDGLHVVGHVQATVLQTCVVTLEPVINQIDEPIEVDYAPPREARKSPQPVDPEDGEAAQSGPDEPEPLRGNSVDLGRLATEFLILGVDPYPRKRDAAFEPPSAAQDSAAHPFAGLAGLSKKGTVKE